MATRRRASGCDHAHMATVFTVAQARATLGQVHQIAEEVVTARADLVEIAASLEGGGSPLGGVPEAKALEARLDDLLGRLRELGCEVKGYAPLLVDFPAELDGEPVLLCWLEGEPDLTWYHRRQHGFAGRRRLPS